MKAVLCLITITLIFDEAARVLYFIFLAILLSLSSCSGNISLISYDGDSLSANSSCKYSTHEAADEKNRP